MLFSKRNKYIPLIKTIQTESVDDELRIRLWNLLKIYYWDKFHGYTGSSSIKDSNFESYIYICWHSFFKLAVDKIPHSFNDVLEIIRKRYFDFQWYEIYDFIEFTIRYSPSSIPYLNNFPKECNVVLKEENSAYRIINGNFTRITDDVEIFEIEESIEQSDKYYGVKTHLKTALSYLSDRKQPDYRNSIKESISAVESICQIITNDKKATLGIALKKIGEMFDLHSALKSAFSNLYGYTSDKDGIRHSYLEKSNLTFNDAKYMLVTCSAFVNYLLGIIAQRNK